MMVKQIHMLFLLLCSAVLLLSACSTQQIDKATPARLVEADPLSLKILALGTRIEQGDSAIIDELARLNQAASSSNHYCLLAYINARRLLADKDIDNAYLALNNNTIQQQLMLASIDTQNRINLLNAEILEAQQLPLTAARLRIFLAPLLDNADDYLANHLRIWQLLNRLDSASIDSSAFRQEQTLARWLELTRIVQHPGLSLAQQVDTISQWQQQYPDHPAALQTPSDIELMRQALHQRPARIAIILPLDGKFRAHGLAIRDGIMHAYYQSDFKPVLLFYALDEQDGFTDIYQEAIYDGADLIIGPLFKSQLQALYQYPELPVPTIALNKLDDDQTTSRPLNLYEFSLAIDDEILSIVQLARRQQQHSSIIISQSDSWASRAAGQFSDQWQQQGGQVLASASFSNAREQSAVVQQLLNISNSRQRSRELQWLTGLNLEQEPRRRQDIDMILLLARQDSATSIRPLLAFHFAGDIPVYANSSVYRGYPDPSADNDLNGIRFTDMPLLIGQTTDIPANYRQSGMIRMLAFGMDAFRLSERIALMALMPQASMYGATGQLSVQHSIIHRQTAYGEFQRGRVRPYQLPAEPDKHP